MLVKVDPTAQMEVSTVALNVSEALEPGWRSVTLSQMTVCAPVTGSTTVVGVGCSNAAGSVLPSTKRIPRGRTSRKETLNRAWSAGGLGLVAVRV